MARVFAPAKINLCLHVTGQREDGYHLLDSLVVFAGVGDWVAARAGGQGLDLTVTGPFAAGLAGDGADNLVLKAARAFGPLSHGAAITLEKNLPIASGIGGGSADAAATLRALAMLWSCPLPPPDRVLSLGADVPVCLAAQPCRMRGIGEVTSPLPPLPSLWLVLANPGIAVPTPAIFKALHHRQNPGLPGALPDLSQPQALIPFLQAARNDLQETAIRLAPPIGQTLTALSRTAGCQLARMSGSGATCFGLYLTEAAAKAAARVLQESHPAWWTQAAPILGPL